MRKRTVTGPVRVKKVFREKDIAEEVARLITLLTHKKKEIHRELKHDPLYKTLNEEDFDSSCWLEFKELISEKVLEDAKELGLKYLYMISSKGYEPCEVPYYVVDDKNTQRKKDKKDLIPLTASQSYNKKIDRLKNKAHRLVGLTINEIL